MSRTTAVPHGFRRPEGFAPTDGRRRAPRVAAAALVPLLGLLLLPRACSSAPDHLSELRLVGARGPACVEIDLLEDESGSMRRYAAARDAALQQVRSWAPGNLRADDRVAVLGWAERASVLLAPTPIGPFRSAPVSAASALGDDTRLAPALRATAAFPATTCSRWLVIVSDGIIADRPGAVRAAARSAAVRGASLLLPDGSAAPAEFTAALPYATALSADPDDPDSMALAVGEAIAASTGQRLQR